MEATLEAAKYYFECNPEILKGKQAICYLNAKPHPLLDILEAQAPVTCMQTFRPFYLQLKTLGKEVRQELKESYDLALVELSKQKEEALWLLGLAARNLNPKGLVIAVGANDTGAKSIQKKLKKDFKIEVESFSKKKCRILLINSDQLKETLVENLLEFAKPKAVGKTELLASPTGFSSKKIDKGSILLSEFFSEIDTSGGGADFGAGYGYLSHSLLNSNSSPKNLSLFEADLLSLECSKRNLSEFRDEVDLKFHWADVLSEVPRESFDWIIMNPPFHIGNKTHTGLGQKFTLAASKALKKKGELLMVANRSLPYEEILTNSFYKFESLVERDGYKVIRAVK